MKISVIMASYNYAEYIRAAIESVINQTFKEWELIIVDDCSTDDSVNVIKSYLYDDRIKLYINEENLGLAGTLQKGISKAQGEWIAFLESDDIFFPNSLEEKYKAVSSGADIIFTGVEMFQDKEKIVDFQRYFDDVNKLFVNLNHSMFIENFQKIIPKINIIPTFSCVMLKRDLLEPCSFTPLCKASLDYYLWAQLSEYKIYYLHQKLTYWRIHRDSYINKDKQNWLKKYMFNISLYCHTIKNKNPYIKPFLILNYMRARLIYLKINREVIKLNIGNNKFIYEIKLT